MKRISGNAAIAALLLAICYPGFSKQTHVIPSVEAALNYHGKHVRKVYIRAGTFTHESYANHYRDLLKKKTHAPVMMVHKHQYYIVDVGPFHNAAGVRKAAENISAATSKKPEQRHNVSSPLVQVAAFKTASPPVPAEQAQPVNVVSQEPSIAEPAVVPKQTTSESKSEPEVQPKTEPQKSTTQSTTSDIFPWKKITVSNPMPAVSRFFNNEYTRTNSPGFFLSTGGGEQFYRVSGNNRLNTGAGWPLDIYTTDSISNQPYFFLAGGYTFARPDEWLPYYSLGLMYTYAHTATISGYIDQYSLPQFRNYNFQYDVQLMTALAILKADIYRWNNVMPYLSLGLGAVNYSATNYNEQALSGVTPRVNPAFGSYAGTNFSSSIGAGIDYAMRKDLWFNVEFNYINYGKITTGNGVNYATDTGTNYDNESLGNSIFATTMLVGVTYYPA